MFGLHSYRGRREEAAKAAAVYLDMFEWATTVILSSDRQADGWFLVLGNSFI